MMKKNKGLFLIDFFLSASTQAQLTKGNWLVGGNFSYLKDKSGGVDAVNSNSRTITVSPNIGYFAFDKFASGLRLNLAFTKQKYPEVNGTSYSISQNLLGAGPFLRYYFLDREKRINVFSEGNFEYSVLFINNGLSAPQDNFKSLRYGLSAGSVIFFNSAVGLEFIGSYTHSSAVEADSKGESIAFKIGFQIHLEKESK